MAIIEPIDGVWKNVTAEDSFSDEILLGAGDHMLVVNCHGTGTTISLQRKSNLRPTMGWITTDTQTASGAWVFEERSKSGAIYRVGVATGGFSTTVDVMIER